MRLDLFLKASRLVLRRSVAQQFCEADRIRVNGRTAKSSKEIAPGDEIEIRRDNRILTVKVLELPTAKQVSKNAAASLVETLSDIRPDDRSLA
jgi:ribosomal 50S subunit-recycling heat shock protein